MNEGLEQIIANIIITLFYSYDLLLFAFNNHQIIHKNISLLRKMMVTYLVCCLEFWGLQRWVQ